MKITIEHYEQTYSIETKHDDLTYCEFQNLIEKISHSLGYPSKEIWEWYREQ